MAGTAVANAGNKPGARSVHQCVNKRQRDKKIKKRVKEDWMCLVCNLLGIYFMQFGNFTTVPIWS